MRNPVQYMASGQNGVTGENVHQHVGEEHSNDEEFVCSLNTEESNVMV